MYKKYKISALLALSALPLSVSAQLNESISVEGKYVPEIIRLDRINTFPSPLRFNLESTPLSYDTRSVPAGFNPTLLPMPAAGWRDTRTLHDNRGYLELGLGSWLNSTLSAGYRVVDDSRNIFGIRLQHNSTSLWKPNLSVKTEDVKQYRYDETLGLYYSHTVDGKGIFSASADYHIGNFNYYGFNPIPFTVPETNLLSSAIYLSSAFYATEVSKVKAPRQTLNDIAARFGWDSEKNRDAICWDAALGVRYFGYSNSPSYRHNSGDDANRELHFDLNGGFSFPMSTTSAVGVDAAFNYLAYLGEKDVYGGYTQPSNYGMVTLTPFYNIKRDNLNIRIGADVDLTFGIDDYSAFHIAPDVKVDFKSGPVGLFVHALGGTVLKTLSNGYELDYYQNPRSGGGKPVYIPLDAEIGANVGPFSGFSASLALKYRVARNEWLGGWFQTYLNRGSQPLENMTGFNSIYYNSKDDLHLHGASVALNLNYSYGNLFSLNADATYQPQNGKKGYFNGYDRPRWTADFSATVNPIKPLKVTLAYQYRGVRNVTFAGHAIDSDPLLGGLGANQFGSYRLPDITLLNLGASWNFTDKFAVWLQGDNLLNRHDDWLPSLPMRGVTVTAGLSVLF